MVNKISMVPAWMALRIEERQAVAVMKNYTRTYCVTLSGNRLGERAGECFRIRGQGTANGGGQAPGRGQSSGRPLQEAELAQVSPQLWASASSSVEWAWQHFDFVGLFEGEMRKCTRRTSSSWV